MCEEHGAKLQELTVFTMKLRVETIAWRAVKKTMKVELHSRREGASTITNQVYIF